MSRRVRNPKPPIVPPGKPEKAKAEAANVETLAQAAKLGRAQECEAIIKAACAKYHCALRVVQIYADGVFQQQQIQIVALDAPPAPGGG